MQTTLYVLVNCCCYHLLVLLMLLHQKQLQKVSDGQVLTSGVSEGVARRQDVRIPTDDATPNQLCRYTNTGGQTFEGFAAITTLPSPFLFNGPLASFIDDVTYNRPAAAFNIRIVCRLNSTPLRRQQPSGGEGAANQKPSIPLPDGQLPASGARAHRDRLRNATMPAPSMPLPDTIDAADRLPASGARAHRDRLRDAAKSAPMPQAPATTPDTPVPTPDATDAAAGGVPPAPAAPGHRSTMPLPDAMIPSSGARARRGSGALPAPQPAPESAMARDVMPAPQVPALQEGPTSERDATSTTPSPPHNLNRHQWMRV